MMMMTFRLSRLFQLLLQVSLKTSSDRWRCVPLFLKLFPSASSSFFFLEICLVICSELFLLVSDTSLGGRPFRSIPGTDMSFFFLVFSGGVAKC